MMYLDLVDALTPRLEPLAPVNPEGDPPRGIYLTVSPGTVWNRRASGSTVDRVHTVTALCTGASRDEAAWLAHHVADTLDGLRLGSPHGTLEDTSFDGDPLPEDPTRPDAWSKTLTFTWKIKRGNTNGN